MIIDREGNQYEIWERKNGYPIQDTDNKYGIEFFIVIPYTERQKALFSETKLLKELLSQTDFKAIKYSEGAYTEEEYAPVKKARAEWRARINEIEMEFVEPSLTREEMDMAEDLAIEKLKEAENANSKSADSTDSGQSGH